MSTKFSVHQVESNANPITDRHFLDAIQSFRSLLPGKTPEAAQTNQANLLGPKILTKEYFLSRIKNPTEAQIADAQKRVEKHNKKALEEQGKVNQLIEALNVAYDEHYPISLSPDMIWLLLAQSLSQHINLHAEELRSKFVSHEGKKEIIVERDEFVKGSAENDWMGAFGEFSSKIKESIGEEMHSLLIPGFSTTGPIEQAASEVVLMEAMQNYFEYSMSTMCGFPWIELQGETADWERMKRKVQHFSGLGLADWVAVLNPILDQFIAASQGQVDQEFWQSFYKLDGGSGGPYVNGWINAFFLYLKENQKNRYALNWEKSGPFCGNNPDSFFSGVSIAPFVWKYYFESFEMEFLAGFAGFVQREDGAIVPAIGWAVREK